MPNTQNNRKTPTKSNKTRSKSKKTSTSKKARGTQLKLDTGLRYEVKLTMLIAGTVFLILAMFTRTTSFVGDFISGVLKGLFSYYAFVIPFALFAIIFLAINQNLSKVKTRVQASAALFSFGMLLFVALIRDLPTYVSIFAKDGLTQAYKLGQTLEGPGVIGRLIYDMIKTPLGITGAWLVLITLVMLFLIFAFEITPTSIGRLLGRSAVKTKDSINKQGESVAKAIKNGVSQLKEDYNNAPAPTNNQEHILELLNEDDFISPSHDNPSKAKNTKTNAPEDKEKTTHILGDDNETLLGNITIVDYNDQEHAFAPKKDTYKSPTAPKSAAPTPNVNVKKVIKSERMDYQSDNNDDLLPPADEQAIKDLKAIKKENANISHAEARQVEDEIQAAVKISYENYTIPSFELLNRSQNKSGEKDKQEIYDKAKLLEETLNNFKVDAKVVQVSRGPMITRFEIQPSPGVKVSKIVNLSDDIALNLAATSVRIVAPIPGKAAVGIEIPNKHTSIVTLRDVVDSATYSDAESPIRFGLGKGISGLPIVADLSKMPHLLIAGATGSGKSVCVNTIISSILLNAKPDEVKFLMIDPKVVELNIYNDIPHLILPVVTDPKKASIALNWAVQEMTDRYKAFADNAVRDITGFNNKIEEQDIGDKMPRIVVIIDELADLMMVAPNQVEDAICRLAQMARAAGIHLIVATQRPSVDVITGVIKANIPSRIAFAVSSSIDSRTIIDSGGAEKLLGKGDMLYYPAGVSKPQRVQGAFISEKEVEKLVGFVKGEVDGELHYDDISLDEVASSMQSMNGGNSGADELLSQAIDFVIKNDKASTSLLQRQFRIGYNRAARMIDELEERGIIGPSRGSKPREVLMTLDEYEMANGQ